MPPRTLKETYSRKKSSEFVESAIDIHGDGVAATLGDKLVVELQEGEEMPDFGFCLKLLARRMARVRLDLEAAAEAHFEELANDDAIRKMRDASMSQLTRAYITSRQTVTDGYSPEDAQAFGFETYVATEPAAMELQTRRLLANFAKPEVQLSEPIYPAIRFDEVEAEATFRPLLDQLVAARTALNQEKRKADETLVAKNQAVAINDAEFGQISRCFEAILALADQPELALRVRPSSRRPGRRQEVEDEPSSLPEDDSPEPSETVSTEEEEVPESIEVLDPAGEEGEEVVI